MSSHSSRIGGSQRGVRTALVGAALLASTALPAFADVPHVATDIAPIHGLVSMVMGDLSTPSLLIPPGATPHSYALRPSEARAIAHADLVVWVGPELTPWLDGAVNTLAAETEVIELLSMSGTERLTNRTAHDHGAVEHEDDHAHDHADDHAGDDHAETGTDPHAWLDPDNAAGWLDAIAEALSRKDPQNAATYAANAAAARAQIEGVTATLAPRLRAIPKGSFIVFHDAYQYFEHRFDLQMAGAVSLSDATAPSAARIAELRDVVAENTVTCAFAEPQFNPGVLKAVAEGASLRILTMDPMGTDLALGAGFYPALLQSLGEAHIACTAGS